MVGTALRHAGSVNADRMVADRMVHDRWCGGNIAGNGVDDVAVLRREATVSGKLLLSHPTGNANVRQALLAFYERELLAGFYTTMAWDGDSAWNRLLPAGVSRELMRRAYPGIPAPLIHAAPVRELCRVLLAKAGMGALVDAPGSPLSTSGVYRHADRWVARSVPSLPLKAVYAYDGGALESFRAARRCGVKTIYELPTAHTGFKAEFFGQEAALQPEFAQTFPRALADAAWLRRKDEELRAVHAAARCGG